MDLEWLPCLNSRSYLYLLSKKYYCNAFCQGKKANDANSNDHDLLRLVMDVNSFASNRKYAYIVFSKFKNDSYFIVAMEALKSLFEDAKELLRILLWLTMS